MYGFMSYVFWYVVDFEYDLVWFDMVSLVIWRIFIFIYVDFGWF